MLRRLKRPGYWIVALMVATGYFYHAYQVREEAARKAALFRLYSSYGEQLIAPLREGNLSGLQASFHHDGKKITLEDIALFVDTLHLEGSPRIDWKGWSGTESNLSLQARMYLEGNRSYPVDMMIVRRGKELLLKRLRIGSKTLEPREREFPMDAFARSEEMERNASLPQASR